MTIAHELAAFRERLYRAEQERNETLYREIASRAQKERNEMSLHTHTVATSKRKKVRRSKAGDVRKPKAKRPKK